MSKNWIMLTGLLFLGSLGTSQAGPLDSPDIVYIDGQPCNSACQSYIAWSRRKTSPQHSAPVESAVVEPAYVESSPVKPAAEKPALRPARSAAPHAKAVQRESSKPAAPRVAKQAVPSPAKVASPQPAAAAAVKSEPAPAAVGNSEPAPVAVVAPPAADDTAATSRTRQLQEQVAAATALAEQVTAASVPPVPQQEATNPEASVDTKASAGPSDTETTASVATNSTDNRVALVIARPEIKSVSDLAGLDVAVEGQQSASSTTIRDAIASAGAAEVKLNEGTVKPLERLVGGEVPAAVLALVSPEAAESFPDIPGYKVFRIPLSPGSKARL